MSSSPEKDESESPDSATNNNGDSKVVVVDEAASAIDDTVSAGTEKIMTTAEEAEAAKVRMKAHVLLAKVEKSEAKRSPTGPATPRESTTDLTQQAEEVIGATDAVPETAEESTIPDVDADAAKKKAEEGEADTLAEA